MSPLAMRCAIRSDVGGRRNNEDAAFGTARLAAVADGVGGAVAGEVASRSVIAEMMSLDKRRIVKRLDDELRDAVLSANETLGFLIACRPELAGMGSTITAVALSNDARYLVANVGDSRTYLHRDGGLRQLSRDQSLVQVLVDQGAITAEAARDHPQRSVVLEALDGRERESVCLGDATARAGDRLLLCSDGLSDVVSDGEIARVLAEPSRERAADQLIGAALDAGVRDNVTVLVADIVVAAQRREGWLDALPWSPRSPKRG